MLGTTECKAARPLRMAFRDESRFCAMRQWTPQHQQLRLEMAEWASVHPMGTVQEAHVQAQNALGPDGSDVAAALDAWHFHTLGPPEQTSAAYHLAMHPHSFTRPPPPPAAVEQCEGCCTALGIVDQGCRQLADVLLQDVQCPILCGRVVARVLWCAEAAQYTVLCVDGTQFSADVVVLAVPVGVLKAGEITFHPPSIVPAPQHKALAALHAFSREKVFMQFESAFWSPDTDVFFPMASDWHVIFVNGRVFREDRVLMADVLPASMGLWEADESFILARMLEVVAATWGDACTRLTAYYITHWAADPLCRGTHCAVAPGGRAADLEALAQPMNNGSLWICGEHAAVNHPLSVLGALESGEAVGCRVAAAAQQLVERSSRAL